MKINATHRQLPAWLDANVSVVVGSGIWHQKKKLFRVE